MAESAGQILTSTSSGGRQRALDALRGLIIVFMALDHANYFIAQRHSSGEYWGGAFPVYTDLPSFLTRFVTHFCAPGFFLLMGAGMSFFAASRRNRGWSWGAVLRHFLLRGLLLVALQLLLINLAWHWGPYPFPSFYIGVLIALGGTMILGSLLLPLRDLPLAGLILILFVGTELLHPAPELWGKLNIDVLNLLLLRPGGDDLLWSNYPILPWLELVIFGMLLGRWMRRDPRKTLSRTWIIGASFLMLFLILRSLDGFGNIRPRPGTNWMDFLNPVKYPPSMTFTLLTTGVNLILLSVLGWLSRRKAAWLNILTAFGRAPLLVYVLHLFLYLALGRLLTPGGSSLLPMYALWLLGLAVLYPLAVWYSGWKVRQPAASPAHLF
ncbi:MAG: heparan-alpha-glucosaminide N-acetyltransferase domain-containing protein [Anaerolineales bacterium]|jgi:uncharacterized membrane protein